MKITMKIWGIFVYFLLPFVVCDLRKPPPRPPLIRGWTQAPAAIEPLKDATTESYEVPTTKAYEAPTTQPPSVVSAPQIIINLVAPSTPGAAASQIQVSGAPQAPPAADSKPPAAAPTPPQSEAASIPIEPEKEDASEYKPDSNIEAPSQTEASSQPEAPSQPEASYEINAPSQPEAPSQVEETSQPLSSQTLPSQQLPSQPLSSQPEAPSQSIVFPQPEAEQAAQTQAQADEAEAPQDIQETLKYKLVPQVIYKKVLDEDNKPVNSPATKPSLPKPQPTLMPVFTRRPAPVFYPISTSTQRVTTKAAPPPSPARVPSPQKLEPFKTNFGCKDGNSYYAVDNECDSYIECKHNLAKKFWCPDGLHFNPNAKHYEYPCAYPSAVKCNAGYQEQSSKPTDQCPRQYGFFPTGDGDCSKYVVCQDGQATIMPCPAGLVFNPSTDDCDYVEKVPQCNPNVFKDYKCPEPPLDEDGFVSDIVYKYKYGNQCKYYIACQRGFPRLLSCEQGLAFDDQWQACIDEDYVADCAKL